VVRGNDKRSGIANNALKVTSEMESRGRTDTIEYFQHKMEESGQNGTGR
jgi:hypothetical protein